METMTKTFQEALSIASQLSFTEKQQLIQHLSQEIEAQRPKTPRKFFGRWKGISLSAEEIDEARVECWKGLGA